MNRRSSTFMALALGAAAALAAFVALRAQPAPTRDDSRTAAERAAEASGTQGMLSNLAVLREFRSGRVSSVDPSGANADGRQDRPIMPGETRTLAEIAGPGAIHHFWVTIASSEPQHLRKLVLRMYWDGEESPSVLAPIGDFFGTGHAEYAQFASLPLAIGSQKAMNSYWFMPFEKGARVTVENQGTNPVGAFYYQVDYRSYLDPAPVRGTRRFHAHYRQEFPTEGFKKQGQDQFSREVNGKPNTTGEGNYVILDTKGRGTFLGVVQHIVQNDDQWWGEGDDMIFIDGDAKPTIHGTGSEDYYLGAWCYGRPFSYPFFGNPRNAWRPEDGDAVPCDQRVPMHRKGAKWTVYRFHIPDPIPFAESIRVTIEHGHANSRSDDVSTTAYWYQVGRKSPLPDLSPAAERLPDNKNPS